MTAEEVAAINVADAELSGETEYHLLSARVGYFNMGRGETERSWVGG